MDTYESYVWEPSLVKINALTAATEAACLVLSIDETVTNPKSEAANMAPGACGCCQCRPCCFITVLRAGPARQSSLPAVFSGLGRKFKNVAVFCGRSRWLKYAAGTFLTVGVLMQACQALKPGEWAGAAAEAVGAVAAGCGDDPSAESVGQLCCTAPGRQAAEAGWGQARSSAGMQGWRPRVGQSPAVTNARVQSAQLLQRLHGLQVQCCVRAS